MLWKVLIILLVLEAFAMIISFQMGGAIYVFIFLTLGAVFIRLSQWFLSALKDIDQLLKLSIYKN